MIVQDEGLVALDPRHPSPGDRQFDGISGSRIAEYRKLLKELGIRGGIAASSDRKTIEITSSARGFATHNSQKGYVHSTALRQEHLVATDLDELSKRGVGSGLRHIDDDWYIFFEGY
jgi:hypothetical protein